MPNKSRKSKSSESQNQYNSHSEPEPKPLHENFRDYTLEELNIIKQENCAKHKCPYLSRINWTSKHNPSHSSNKQLICNYILVAQHSRGCMPDVCTYWADKGVKCSPSNRHLFNKSNSPYI